MNTVHLIAHIMKLVSSQFRPRPLLAALAALLPVMAAAQQLPNAGRILQEQQQAEPPVPAASPDLNMSSPIPDTVAPGARRPGSMASN